MKNKNPSLQQVAFIRPKMVKKYLNRIENTTEKQKKMAPKFKLFNFFYSKFKSIKVPREITSLAGPKA